MLHKKIRVETLIQGKLYFIFPAKTEAENNEILKLTKKHLSICLRRKFIIEFLSSILDVKN